MIVWIRSNDDYKTENEHVDVLAKTLRTLVSQKQLLALFPVFAAVVLAGLWHEACGADVGYETCVCDCIDGPDTFMRKRDVKT